MKIVVLDDNTAFLRSLQIVLEQENHCLRCFSDYQQAKNYFTQGGSAEVLLLDYFIAANTGVEFLANVRALIPADCIIIMMSAHTEQIPKLILRKYCVDDILQKPINLTELQKILNAG